ncbi:MAG: hypothetical protein IT431_07895 [Phycisphaerales bacterium]|nr:hypothetical protein [Phycisphaerales bacterium]
MPESTHPSPMGEPSAPVLAEELTGALCCASCGYELRGLTIMGTCPECGLPIQATLLSLVDPRAAEIQPIRSRRTVAAGLAAWVVGAMTAVVLGWAVWVSGLVDRGLTVATQDKLIAAGAIGLVLSGVGALVIIRPHGAIPRWQSAAAAVGVLLYPPAIYLYVQLGAIASAGPGPSLLAAWSGRAESMPWRWERMGMWLILAAGAACLRWNLRILAARSLVLRAERVDRQTIAASVAALLIAAGGDGLGLAAPLAGGWGGQVALAGEMLVGLGALLLTLAMIGITIDTFRVIPAVLQRPLAMADLVA